MTTVALFLDALPYSYREDDIAALVKRASGAPVLAVRQRMTMAGRAFVDVLPADAERVIKALDGRELDGRTLRCAPARPRKRP